MDSDPDSLSNSDLMPLDGTTATPEHSTALANVERVITCRVALMPHRIICAQRLGNQRSHRSTTQHHLCATVFCEHGHFTDLLAMAEIGDITVHGCVSRVLLLLLLGL
ncbi:trans-sialidase [Trypanosoma cruzi]|nr:trans-sialidase [Trypanosoma cruzi]